MVEGIWRTVAQKFAEVKARGGKFGVIGSNHTTNEENFYLQKFARQGLGTNNIDHHRTGDVVTLLDALSGTYRYTCHVRPIFTSARRCWSWARIWRSSSRFLRSRFAPISGITRRTFTR